MREVSLGGGGEEDDGDVEMVGIRMEGVGVLSGCRGDGVTEMKGNKAVYTAASVPCGWAGAVW